METLKKALSAKVIQSSCNLPGNHAEQLNALKIFLFSSFLSFPAGWRSLKEVLMIHIRSVVRVSTRNREGSCACPQEQEGSLFSTRFDIGTIFDM